MKVGDTVVATGDNRLLGELVAIDNVDRATVRLRESGVEVMIHLCYLTKVVPIAVNIWQVSY